MDNNELDKIYQTVSVELSNPFSTIGTYTKSKFKQLFDAVRKASDKTFDGVERNHANGLYKGLTDLQNNIDNKKVVYMDFLPLQVYVPSFLKPKVYFLDYILLLEEQMDLMGDIVKNATAELDAIISGYIGSPDRLRDPNLITTSTEGMLSISGMYDRYETLAKSLTKVVTTSNGPSTRTFGETFARVADWKQSNVIMIKVNRHFYETVRDIDQIKRDTAAVNARVGKLVELIEKNSNYEMSANVGQYLAGQIYKYAKLNEIVGSSLFAAQVSIKALTDTNIAIDRALG